MSRNLSIGYVGICSIWITIYDGIRSIIEIIYSTTTGFQAKKV